jgi:hypothetical protein
MPNPTIYADFQNLDEFNQLKLAEAGIADKLTQQGILVQEGLVLTLCTDSADDDGQPDELRVEGVLHFQDSEQCWVASIDWTTVRRASDEIPNG